MVWLIAQDTNARGSIYVSFRNRKTKESSIIDPKTGEALSQTFHSMRLWSHFNRGPHPEPDIVPKIAYLSKERKRFPLIFSIFGNFCVQKPFVDLVERFEPGMHEYFPIKLIAEKTGEELPVEYFLMNICQVLESVVLDHPSVRIEHTPITNRYTWHYAQTMRDLFFHKDIVQGHHLWTDKGGGQHQIFASDEFVDAFEAAGMKGIAKYYHYEKVSIVQLDEAVQYDGIISMR